MPEFMIRFTSDTFYNTSDMEEMKEAVMDALVDIDDEIHADTVTFEKYEEPSTKKVDDKKPPTQGIGDEQVARNWLAENDLLENIRIVADIHEANA